MDANILNLLQGLSDPSALAGGMASFFKKHVTRIKNLLTSIVNQVPVDPDDVGSTFDLGSGPFVIANTDVLIKSFQLEDLTVAVKAFLSDADVIPTIPVEVRNYAGGTTTYEYLTYDQIIEALKEQGDVADGLITTLTSYKDWLDNTDLNFEQLTLERLGNLLSDDSVVAAKLKQGVSSIATRFSDSIREYGPSVLQNIMSLFGVGADSYTDQQVTAYEGINAWTVVLGDVIDGISYIVSQARTVAQKLFDTIGFAMGKLLLFAGTRLIRGVEKVIFSLVGANNAFKANSLPGDSSVTCCDWRYTANSQYYSYGTQSFKDLCDKLSDFWNNRESSELSIPLFAGTLNVQRLDQYRTGINLVIKPLNVTAVNVAWNKTMSGSHLFYCLVQSNSGVISRNTATCDYDSSFDRDDLANFFTELAKNPSLYYLDNWKTDADAFMACQCAKIICFMQLLLMCEDIPDGYDFVDVLEACSGLADFDIENQPNYSAQYHNIEISNYNMMNYLCSFERLTTAFNNGAGEYNDFTPANYTQIAALTQLWNMLYYVIDVIGQLDAIGSSSPNCFLPYQSTITYRRGSFYIPSDADNINLVKGIIKTGLTVAAIATVVIVGLAVRSAVKKKAFALEAQAGSLSWDAAGGGNASKMSKAYRLSRRANILGRLAGYVQSGSTEAMRNLFGVTTEPDVTLLDIKHLIAG